MRAESDICDCSVGEKPDIDHNPPILYHNSRGRFTSSCNCGRKQAPREDPFDIQAANYDFYQVRSENLTPLIESHTYRLSLMRQLFITFYWCL